MAVERLLFRAGRQGYTYPEILEVRLGSLRILVPSAESIRRVHVLSTVVALAYIFIAGPLLGAVALALMPNVGGVAVGVAAGVVFFLGLFGVLVWWDRWSLPLLAVPTDTMSGSDVLMPSTLSSSGTPTTRSRRLTSTVIFIKISGRLAGGPTTRPTRPSAFVSTGSRFVPIAMSPPGRTSFRADPPVWSDRIVVVMFFHSVLLPSVTWRPGDISISSPTFMRPSIRLPPSTPPTIFSGGMPGWFTSNERATYIFAGFPSLCGLQISVF